MSGQDWSLADDFVICCQGEAGKALQATREILGRLGLKLNETKTCVRRLPEESLDFLGYTLGICHRARSGVPYLGTRPSKKSIGKICREIHRETRPWSGLRSPEQEVARLNRMLVGWANTSAWVGSAKPIGRWMPTPDGCFVSGCDENTRSKAARERGSSRTSSCTKGWGWYD